MPARAAVPDPRPSQPTSRPPAIRRPEASVTVTPDGPMSCATTVSPDTSATPGAACIAARKAAYRNRSSRRWPIGPSSISAASKCRKNGAAPSPARPSLALICRIGCALSRTRSQMPMAVSSRTDATANA